MALAFAELTGGVKFDGKKLIHAEMSRFSVKKTHGGGGGGSGSARSGEGASGSRRTGGRDGGNAGGSGKKKQKDLASRKRERARGEPTTTPPSDDDAVGFGVRHAKPDSLEKARGQAFPVAGEAASEGQGVRRVPTHRPIRRDRIRARDGPSRGSARGV